VKKANLAMGPKDVSGPKKGGAHDEKLQSATRKRIWATEPRLGKLVREMGGDTIEGKHRENNQRIRCLKGKVRYQAISTGCWDGYN